MRADDVDGSEDPWLTVADIAEELRCSPATIRSWISKGTLPATRPGERKLLVRRSDLSRKLGRDTRSASAGPPPDRSDEPRSARLVQTPDSISSITWSSEDREAIDPEDWLGVAQWEWLAALNASRMAPPDAAFAGRLTQIAEAAARKADALTQFDDDAEMRWDSEPTSGEPLVLSYELRPDGNRPGSADLWARFDQAVGALDGALQTARAVSLRRALEEVSVALHDIAEDLRRFGGRSSVSTDA